MRSTVVNVIGLALAVSVVAALILAAVTKRSFTSKLKFPPLRGGLGRAYGYGALCGMESYPVEVRGTHAVGSQLVAVFDAPEIKPFEVQLTVIEMDSPRLLRQGGGFEES